MPRHRTTTKSRTSRPVATLEALERRCLLSSVYMLPTAPVGSDGTGSSWANAKAATVAAINAAWDQIAAGEAVYLGSGTYPVASKIYLDTAGTAGASKTLRGVDTGGGLPLLQGNWDLGERNVGGGVSVLASNVVVDSLRLANMEYAVRLELPRDQTNVKLSNITVNSALEGFLLDGGAAGLDNRGLTKLEVNNCTVTGFEKRGFRVRDGVRDARLIGCVADAGGAAWAGEPFHIGFEVYEVKSTDAPNRNVLFYGSTAKRAWHNSQPGDYRNGDGYTAERGNTGIVYQNCRAFDNTDGGFDVKAEASQFLNCVAIGNYRNFRIWGDNVTMTNCLGAWGWRNANNTGAGTSGLWVADSATNLVVERSTFHNNGFNVYLDDDTTTNVSTVTVTDSILSIGTGTASYAQQKIIGGGNTLSLNASNVQWKTPATTPANPAYPNSESTTLYAHGSTDWTGSGNNFDSATYPDKGYSQRSIGRAYGGGAAPVIAATGTTTIEVEDYDLGGASVAYHDSTAAHNGSTYRDDEAVDTVGTPTGYGIGYINSSEWLTYTVRVAQAGTYQLGAVVSTSSASQSFELRNALGQRIAGPITFGGPTGGYVATATASVTLPAGLQRLTFKPLSSSFSIDALTFTMPAGLAAPARVPGSTLPRPVLFSSQAIAAPSNWDRIDEATREQDGRL